MEILNSSQVILWYCSEPKTGYRVEEELFPSAHWQISSLVSVSELCSKSPRFLRAPLPSELCKQRPPEGKKRKRQMFLMHNVKKKKNEDAKTNEITKKNIKQSKYMPNEYIVNHTKLSDTLLLIFE